ncbi:hypothetical protein VaNZ11_016834, partial [Volvox africanus]
QNTYCYDIDGSGAASSGGSGGGGDGRKIEGCICGGGGDGAKGGGGHRGDGDGLGGGGDVFCGFTNGFCFAQAGGDAAAGPLSAQHSSSTRLGPFSRGQHLPCSPTEAAVQPLSLNPSSAVRLLNIISKGSNISGASMEPPGGDSKLAGGISVIGSREAVDVGFGGEPRGGIGATSIGSPAASPACPVHHCICKDHHTLRADSGSCEVLHTRLHQLFDGPPPPCSLPVASTDPTLHPQLPEHSSGPPQRHRLQCPYLSPALQSKEQRFVQYNSTEPASPCTNISTFAPASPLAAVDSTGPMIIGRPHNAGSRTTLGGQQELNSGSGGAGSGSCNSGGGGGGRTSETMESAAPMPSPSPSGRIVKLAEKISPAPRPRLAPSCSAIRSQLEGQPVPAAFNPGPVPERRVPTRAFNGTTFRTTWSAVDFEPLDDFPSNSAMSMLAGGDGVADVGQPRNSCSISRKSASLQRRRLETVSGRGDGEEAAAAVVVVAAVAAAVPASSVADGDGDMFLAQWRAVHSSFKVDAPEAEVKATEGVRTGDVSGDFGDGADVLMQWRSSLDHPPSSSLVVGGSTALDRYAALTAHSPSWKYTAMYDMHDAKLLARLMTNRISLQRGMMIASCTGAVSRVESRQGAAAAVTAAVVTPRWRDHDPTLSSLAVTGSVPFLKPTAAVAAAAASTIPVVNSVGFDTFMANGGFTTHREKSSPARRGPAGGSDSTGAPSTALSATSHSLAIRGSGIAAAQAGELTSTRRSAPFAPPLQPPATVTFNAASAHPVGAPALAASTSTPRPSHGADVSAPTDVAAAASASAAANGCGSNATDGGSPRCRTGSRSSPYSRAEPDKQRGSRFWSRSSFRNLIGWPSNETTTWGSTAAATVAGTGGRVALGDRGIMTAVNVTGGGGSCTSAGEGQGHEGGSERRQRPTAGPQQERFLVSWKDTLQALRYQAIHGDLTPRSCNFSPRAHCGHKRATSSVITLDSSNGGGGGSSDGGGGGGGGRGGNRQGTKHMATVGAVWRRNVPSVATAARVCVAATSVTGRLWSALRSHPNRKSPPSLLP